MQQRFLQALGELGGAFRPSDEPLVDGNDEGRIRFTNVPACAHVVGRAAGFFEPVAAWNDAVLGPSTFRTPAAMANALGNGPIQCRAIHTGLAAGNDFEWRLVHRLLPGCVHQPQPRRLTDSSKAGPGTDRDSSADAV